MCTHRIDSCWTRVPGQGREPEAARGALPASACKAEGGAGRCRREWGALQRAVARHCLPVRPRAARRSPGLTELVGPEARARASRLAEASKSMPLRPRFQLGGGGAGPGAEPVVVLAAELPEPPMGGSPAAQLPGARDRDLVPA